MTVADLITLLQSEDPSRLVVLASDREGSDHSPLDELMAARYIAANTWSGDLDWECDSDEGVAALVLRPVN